jgi:hypothetical protein
MGINKISSFAFITLPDSLLSLIIMIAGGKSIYTPSGYQFNFELG